MSTLDLPNIGLEEGKEHYANLKVWTVNQHIFEEGVIDTVEQHGLFTYDEACNVINNVLQPNEKEDFGVENVGCYTLCIEQGDVEGDETFEIDEIEY